MQWLAVLAFALTVRAQRLALLLRRRPALALHRRLRPRSPAAAAVVRRIRLVDAAAARSRTSPARISFGAAGDRPLQHARVACPWRCSASTAIATRIGGRLFGYWAAALWIALPYFGILFVEPGYHQKYTELTIPHIVGLTAMSDFPSMVGAPRLRVLLPARARERQPARRWWPPGFAAGYAIAVKPSSAIFLFGPALLLLLTRWRTILPFVLGLAPALRTLALWKYRGLGHLRRHPGGAGPARRAASATSCGGSTTLTPTAGRTSTRT